MADQTVIAPDDQETIDAISSAEQFFMFEENNDGPLFDSLVNNTVNDPRENGYCDTSFSRFYLEENRHDGNIGSSNYFQTNEDYVNPMHVPVGPVPPSTQSCICCQTLREIFHINGAEALKLELHGRLGIITHAIEERYSTDMSSQYHEYQKFDFRDKSISCVKQFLIQYCDDRRKEGYIILEDPLSSFYEALCVGLDGYDNQEPGNFQGRTNTNQDSLNQPVGEGSGVGLTKSYIAAQRERAGKLKLRDLAEYFHLPISAASKEMNICASAIKKICRKEGLERWPHRKIKSIRRQISEKKKKSLNSSDGYERERALAQIHELEQRLEFIRGENDVET